MPTYQIKAPDGNTYAIDGPPNATDDQVRAEVLRQHPNAGQAASAHPAAPAAQPGFLSQMLHNTVGDVAALAKGAGSMVDLATEGAGKVMSVVPTLAAKALDATGHPAAANQARNVAHAFANPYTIGGTIEKVVPPAKSGPQWWAELGMNLLGGSRSIPKSVMSTVASKFAGQVPENYHPTMANAAEKMAPKEVVADAKQANIPVLTSDVRPPRTFIGNAVRATGERIPFIGTGPVRAAQQAARIDAIKSVAQDYGAATGDELANPAIDSVAKDLATRRGAELDRLTAAKTSVIEKVPGVVPVPSTLSAIDQQIGKLQAVGTDAANAVIGKLQNWRQAVQAGKNLPTIELIRKEMGDAFKDPNLAAIRSTGEKALTAIYGPLREDMGNFIKANGKQGDFAKWQNANDALSGMAGELKVNSLKRVLNTAETTPENVSSLLFSNNPSDVRRLYAGLSPLGRSKAQAAILQKAVENSGGLENLSPDKFASQMTRLAKSVGVVFQGDDLARIEGLTRVLKTTQRAAQAAVAPPTGVQNVPIAMAGGLTALLGLPKAIAAAGGIGGLARAYESAPVRNLLLKIGQSKAGSVQEGQLMKRLGTAVAAVAGNQARSTSIGALNDNIPAISSVAASPGSDTQGQQQ